MAIYPEIDSDTFAKSMKDAPRVDSVIGDLWQRAEAVTAKEYAAHFNDMQARGLTAVFVPEGD